MQLYRKYLDLDFFVEQSDEAIARVGYLYSFCDHFGLNVAKILSSLIILLPLHPIKEVKMLELSYVGPKPIINQYGVFFQKSKIDKYIYLPYAIGIFQSIHQSHKAHVDIYTHRLPSDLEIIQIIHHHYPNLHEKMMKKKRKIERDLVALTKHIENKNYLSKEEKRIWIKNIEIMTPYVVQRKINKLYYIYTLKLITKAIHERQISSIAIDFDLHKWHILRSISGNLTYEVGSIKPSMILETNHTEQLLIKLYIRA